MNKLGITSFQRIQNIEYNLFNTKYHMIDEIYTFDEEEIFNIKYLEKLHLFLFNDIYDMKYCKIREEIPKEEVNKKLEELKYLLIAKEIEKIKTIIYEIWEYQIFYDGNTRTLLRFQMRKLMLL